MPARAFSFSGQAIYSALCFAHAREALIAWASCPGCLARAAVRACVYVCLSSHRAALDGVALCAHLIPLWVAGYTALVTVRGSLQYTGTRKLSTHTVYMPGPPRHHPSGACLPAGYPCRVLKRWACARKIPPYYTQPYARPARGPRCAHPSPRDGHAHVPIFMSGGFRPTSGP